eukprot:5369667-Lingulodinium_polyedra.AAC.1
MERDAEFRKDFMQVAVEEPQPAEGSPPPPQQEVGQVDSAIAQRLLSMHKVRPDQIPSADADVRAQFRATKAEEYAKTPKLRGICSKFTCGDLKRGKSP